MKSGEERDAVRSDIHVNSNITPWKKQKKKKSRERASGTCLVHKKLRELF